MLERLLNDLHLSAPTQTLPLCRAAPTHPAAVHLHGEREDPPFHLLSQRRLLPLIAILKHLLGDIVAKQVGHQGVRIRHDLIKQLLTFLDRRGLKTLLDKARAVLVTRKLDDVTPNILQRQPEPCKL
jgi:hypothetical protein